MPPLVKITAMREQASSAASDIILCIPGPWSQPADLCKRWWKEAENISARQHSYRRSDLPPL